MKRLLTLYDIQKSELENLINRTVEIFKEIKSRSFRSEKLKGKVGLIYFEKASTRTRISFESAIKKLGGSAIYVSPKDTQMSRGESPEDFVKSASGYVDFIIARVYDHRVLEVFSEVSGIPVVNALSNLGHPTQIISDLASIEYILGGYKGKTILFVGDARNNVSRSWAEASSILKVFRLIFSAPPELKPDFQGDFEFDEDLGRALKKADVVYTDTWFSMGEEFSQKKEELLRRYSLDSTKNLEGKVVMHCLPAYRGKEISEEVYRKFEGVIITQAHFKLACAAAVIEGLTV